MSISGLTALSLFTDKAPASPAYFNAKFAEIAANFSALTTNAQSTLSGAGYLFASEYGVTANGSTDDTSAVQTVLTLAAATGKTAIFSAGTHKLVGPVSFPSGVKAQGVGNGGTIFYAGTAGMTNISTASADAWIDGIYFKGSGTSNGGERGIDVSNQSRVKVTNCRFGYLTNGVRFSGLSAMDGEVSTSIFQTIVGKFGVSEGYGVNTSGQNLRVVNNRFTDIMRHAVYLASSASGCLVADNVISGLSQHAIQVYALSSQNGCFSNAIVGNVISDMTQAVGVRVSDFAHNTLIANNIISGFSGSNCYGIFVSNGVDSSTATRGKRCIISGNRIDAPVRNMDAILIQNFDDVLVTGNLLSGNSKGYGVQVTASAATPAEPICRNIHISGNWISDCSNPILLSSTSVVGVLVGTNSYISNVADRVQSTATEVAFGSWRTAAFASLTSAFLAPGEYGVAFGASGCSLAFRSGGTVWYPNSSLSTKG